MFDVKLKKEVDINEQGTANGTYRVEFKNKSDKPEPLPFFSLGGGASDVVDIQVRDADGPLPYVKSARGGSVGVTIDLRGKKLAPKQTFVVTVRCTIPSMVRRFGDSYFCKELHRHNLKEVDICEYATTYTLPKLFSRKEFWKEMYVNAPEASDIYTSWERRVLEYQFVIKSGRNKEISFMFEKRYNSKILTLFTFILGIGFIEFFDWLMSLIM